MDYVGDNDIVFIGSDKPILDVFDKNNVDYDVFYPSVERKNEFIENQVRKRAPHNIIRDMDMHFNEWIDDIDGNNSPNCYKHKMNNKGEYIGNMPLIMQYIDTLKNQPKQTN